MAIMAGCFSTDKLWHAVKAGTQFWRDWVIANAVGEILGLGIAAVVILTIYRAHPANPSAAIVLASALITVLFGAYEGAVVGYAQWIVLRRRLHMAAKSWVTATTLTATAAWALGMAPSTIMKLSAPQQPGQPMPETGPLLTLLLSAGLGIVSGLILASAQASILRRYARRAGWWLPANAAAWAVGMPIIFFAAGLPTAETPIALIIAVLIATIGLTGAVVGAIHGAVLTVITAP